VAERGGDKAKVTRVGKKHSDEGGKFESGKTVTQNGEEGEEVVQGKGKMKRVASVSTT